MKLFAKKALIISAAALLMIAMIAIGVYAATGAESKTDSHVASAVVGGKTLYYTDLATAINEADEGSTVTVLKQIAVTKNTTITSDKNVTVSWAGTKTAPLFVVDGGYEIVITAAEGKVIDFQLADGPMIRFKNSATDAVAPVVKLTNVKAKSTTHVIVTAYVAKVNPTISIVGGVYDSDTYFLSTLNMESNGANDTKDGAGQPKNLKLTLDNAIFNSGIAYTRYTYSDVNITNCTVDLPEKTYGFCEYNSSYAANIVIDRGTYTSNGYAFYYAPDNHWYGLNAKNATFKATSGYAFDFRCGYNAVNIENCEIISEGDYAIRGSQAGYDIRLGLQLTNTTVTAKKSAFTFNKPNSGKIHHIAFNFDDKALFDAVDANSAVSDFLPIELDGAEGRYVGGTSIDSLAYATDKRDGTPVVLTLKSDVTLNALNVLGDNSVNNHFALSFQNRSD